MIPVWFMRAPAKVTVLLWHVSHGALVGMWFAGLPRAVVPLWQLAQFPVIPAWLKAAVGAAGFGAAVGAAIVGDAVFAVGVDTVGEGAALIWPVVVVLGGLAIVGVVIAGAVDCGPVIGPAIGDGAPVVGGLVIAVVARSDVVGAGVADGAA